MGDIVSVPGGPTSEEGGTTRTRLEQLWGNVNARDAARALKDRKHPRVPISDSANRARWKRVYVPRIPAYVMPGPSSTNTGYGSSKILASRSVSAGLSGHVTHYLIEIINPLTTTNITNLYDVPESIAVGNQRVVIVLPMKRLVVYFSLNEANPGKSRLQVMTNKNAGLSGDLESLSLKTFNKLANDDDGTDGWELARSAFRADNPQLYARYELDSTNIRVIPDDDTGVDRSLIEAPIGSGLPPLFGHDISATSRDMSGKFVCAAPRWYAKICDLPVSESHSVRADWSLLGTEMRADVDRSSAHGAALVSKWNSM